MIIESEQRPAWASWLSHKLQSVSTTHKHETYLSEALTRKRGGSETFDATYIYISTRVRSTPNAHLENRGGHEVKQNSSLRHSGKAESRTISYNCTGHKRQALGKQEAFFLYDKIVQKCGQKVAHKAQRPPKDADAPVE